MRYNSTITFQEVSEAADDGGSVVETWSEVSGLTSVPCIIDDISSTERVMAEKNGHLVSQRIFLDYNSLITKDQRIINSGDLADGWATGSWDSDVDPLEPTGQASGAGFYMGLEDVCVIGQKYKVHIVGTSNFTTAKVYAESGASNLYGTLTSPYDTEIEFVAVTADVYIVFTGSGTFTMTTFEIWNNDWQSITYLRNPNNLDRKLEIDIYKHD